MVANEKSQSRDLAYDKCVAETTVALDKVIPPSSESSRYAKYIAYRLISLGYVYPEDVVRMLSNLYNSARKEVVK